ncbi:MAG: hypothetical protein ABIK83_02225, partial [Candidatus Zixiibacteriota bacterium]
DNGSEKTDAIHERASEIASDIVAQWEPRLFSTYSYEELKEVDFSKEEMPLDWFYQWKADLDCLYGA